MLDAVGSQGSWAMPARRKAMIGEAESLKDKASRKT